MIINELRAKFEAWCRSKCWPIHRGGEQYDSTPTQHTWEGCQFGYASRDAEVEALRKDAERYRWLRNSDRIPDGDYLDTHLVVTDASGEDVLWNNSLDVTIDAAMQAE